MTGRYLNGSVDYVRFNTLEIDKIHKIHTMRFIRLYSHSRDESANRRAAIAEAELISSTL